jgi:hypothetical protein
MSFCWQANQGITMPFVLYMSSARVDKFKYEENSNVSKPILMYEYLLEAKLV